MHNFGIDGKYKFSDITNGAQGIVLDPKEQAEKLSTEGYDTKGYKGY